MAAEIASTLLRHVIRDDDDDTPVPACKSDNGYDGRLGVRISAIFVILVGGFFGSVFPVFASRRQRIGVPKWAFFFAKFFGSGVIVATAFIHLLAPANEALTDPCLANNPISDYSWVEGIALMTVFVMFFVELMVMRFSHFEEPGDHHTIATTKDVDDEPKDFNHRGSVVTSPHMPGEDHLGHSRDHTDAESLPAKGKTAMADSYAAQLTGIFILEFGVIFHSIFIGLTLAVTSGSDFNVLYVVLVFHQTFEGLGLGSRLAAVNWAPSKRWTPYFLGFGYSLSTPIAIAIGLGVRTTYAPGSATALITNGVFDSISAGILLYTGLVELMAHEFIFSSYMSKAPLKTMLLAFFWMCLGAGLMALLGKWA